MKGHETPHAVQCRGSDKNCVFVVRGNPRGENVGQRHRILGTCPAMRVARSGATEETEANPCVPCGKTDERTVLGKDNMSQCKDMQQIENSNANCSMSPSQGTAKTCSELKTAMQIAVKQYMAGADWSL